VGEILDRDPLHLRRNQYRDSSNITKRSDLHVKYRTAPRGVFEWFRDLLPVGDGDVILDVGCGPGWLWQTLAPTLPGGVRLTLADVSHGMLSEAAARTEQLDSVGVECDAQSLPFADDAFDLVVSTYALYHVPDPRRAVRELARVGRNVAIATNGPDHLREIEDVRAAVLGEHARSSVLDAFPPSDAAAFLVELFDEVTWTRYDDVLHCLDADDVLAFALSYPPGERATQQQAAEMRSLVERVMAANDGVFVVHKDTGAIIGRRRRSEPARP
jgi:SAM-dependent methyltransferase